MSIPSNTPKLFIFRQPYRSQSVYSIFSEDKNYSMEVTFGSAPMSFFGWKGLVKRDWIVVFKSANRQITATRSANSLSYKFWADGDLIGHAYQASLSIMGKSLVKNEVAELLGSVVSRLRTTRFLLSEGNEIGLAKLYRAEKQPIFLGPSKAHLARRYVLDLADSTRFDERLMFCFVCNLISSEMCVNSS